MGIDLKIFSVMEKKLAKLKKFASKSTKTINCDDSKSTITLTPSKSVKTPRTEKLIVYPKHLTDISKPKEKPQNHSKNLKTRLSNDFAFFQSIAASPKSIQIVSLLNSEKKNEFKDTSEGIPFPHFDSNFDSNEPFIAKLFRPIILVALSLVIGFVAISVALKSKLRSKKIK